MPLQIKKFLFRIAVPLLCAFVISDCMNTEGYYWREYTGVVPNDALKGGQDQHDNPIYIAQVLDGNNLVTGKIHNNKVYYALAGTENVATEYIKILCTKHPERFNWINTKADEIHLLTDKHVIIGGYEPSYTMYIGRANYKMRKEIGKVSTSDYDHNGLYITYDGKEVNIKSFEILTYDHHYNNTKSGACKRILLLTN